MAGPRQPIALVEAKGKKHLTKKEIEERKSKELKVNSDKVKAPGFLSKKLKKEFDVLSEDYRRLGILDNLDCKSLANHVRLQHEFERITKVIDKVAVTNENYDKYIANYIKLSKVVATSQNNFLMNPSSRCKVVVPSKQEEKPVNKFSKFIK